MTASGQGGERDFPWTWDQHQRYTVLREILAASLPPDGRPLRVLDVGGVSPVRSGTGVWFPVRRIHDGPAVVCDVADIRDEGYVRTSGDALPFPGRSFDVVSAMDVLEHVPADRREAFIGELCRVSSGLAVLSAPCRGSGLEEVESLLFEQLKRLYGVENTPLLEHRRYGLPDAASVSEALARCMPAGASFGFGRLADTLVFHYLRNQFLLRKSSACVLEELDAFLAAQAAVDALTPPFARMFWVYGREISQDALDERVRAVLRRIVKSAENGAVSPAVSAVADAIRNFHAGDMVSALVALPSGTKRLSACLDHLLAQDADFDIEICVWDPEGKPEIRGLLAASYPGVRVLGSAAEGATAAGFMSAAASLRGDWVLLVSDRAQLPQGIAAGLSARARDMGGSVLLAPRNIRRRVFDLTSQGGRLSPARLFAGRIPRPARHIPRRAGERAGDGHAEAPPASPQWLYSECLLFRKRDAALRRFPGGRLRRRDVFFWEIGGRGIEVSVVPECSVFIR